MVKCYQGHFRVKEIPLYSPYWDKNAPLIFSQKRDSVDSIIFKSWDHTVPIISQSWDNAVPIISQSWENAVPIMFQSWDNAVPIIVPQDWDLHDPVLLQNRFFGTTIFTQMR